MSHLSFQKKIVFLLIVASQIVFASCQNNNTKNSMNRLAQEKSPYLLQHKNNPVDWYPWGEEAFAKAKKENKPIFLSIGYATCHWCHVMEHESFEDTAVAALMNEAFVNIKVDREERPDIDQVYMTVCQMLTGSGGWPLTIIMTPDKEPFFAGTYYPKNGRSGRPGMMDLVPQISNAWKTKRDQIDETIKQINEGLVKIATKKVGNGISSTITNEAFQKFSSIYDEKNGGFGNSPKFPSPHNILFLLRHWKESGNKESLNMATNTLEKMRLGGIYDQVGFGFHRYSTDKTWLVPHFEKMLYDQAMLMMAYSEAYQATKNPLFKQTVQEIATYIKRDMTDVKGGFYSAEDADSEGVEGKFYVWKKKELIEILGEEKGSEFIKAYGVSSEGNFEDESTGEINGENIVFLNDKNLANKFEVERAKLFEVREKRIHPLKDDKVLTDWNGLMIAALAKASVSLQDESLATMAENSAQFVLTTMYKKGELKHRYRLEDVAIDGHADDYAMMIWGFMELYEATAKVDYLTKALELQNKMDELFLEEEKGGYYFTSNSAEKLLVRQMEVYDGAIPSSNSISLLNLARFYKVTGDEKWTAKADKLALLFSDDVMRSPTAHSLFLSAYMLLANESIEVVFTEPKNTFDDELIGEFRTKYIPNKVVVYAGNKTINKLAPFTEFQQKIGNSTTVYVCKNFSCQLPTNNIETMLKLLEN
ncbi:MAG: hypothetical protein ACJAZ3_000926 [Sphingobacteriales bacterium]